MKVFLVFLSLAAFAAAGPASSGVYVQYLRNRRIQCRENCRRVNPNVIGSIDNCAIVNCPPAVRNGCAPPDCSLAGNILRLHPHIDPNKYWQCQRTDDFGAAMAIERHCACGTVFSATKDETRCVHPFEWLPDCAAHPQDWRLINLSEEMCREDCEQCGGGGNDNDNDNDNDDNNDNNNDDSDNDDGGNGNGDNCLCINICISFPCAPAERNCACNGSNNNNNVQQQPAPPRNEWESPQQPVQPWERPAPPQDDWHQRPWERPAPPQDDWHQRPWERPAPPQNDWQERQNELERRQNEWEQRQKEWEQRQKEWEQEQRQRELEQERRQERPQWFAAEEVAAKEE